MLFQKDLGRVTLPYVRVVPRTSTFDANLSLPGVAVSIRGTSRRMILIDSIMPLRRIAGFATPADGPRSKAVSSFTGWWLYVVIITLFQVKIDFFNNELSLLVLLTMLVRLGVGPANHGIASSTEYVTHAM
jgi:hypothetical protein